MKKGIHTFDTNIAVERSRNQSGYNGQGVACCLQAVRRYSQICRRLHVLALEAVHEEPV